MVALPSAARRALALLAALALGLVLAIAGQTSTARAADIGPQLINIEASLSGSTSPTNGWGSRYDLTYNACVPDSANADDTWTVQLPTEIENWPAGATGYQDGVAVIEITIDAATDTATYTLTEAGAAISNLCFTSVFGGQLQGQQGIDEPTPWELVVRQDGAIITTYPITIQPRPVDTAPAGSWKSMWFTEPRDQCRTDVVECMTVSFTIKAGDQGVVRIEDTASDAWRFVCDTVAVSAQDYNQDRARTDRTDDAQITCNPDGTSLSVVIDTTGTAPNTATFVTVNISALVPGGDGPVRYTNEATMQFGSDEPREVSTHTQSSYVGVLVTGAHITIHKTDAAGNDANTADRNAELASDRAVLLPNGNTGLTFTIVNTGTQTLTDVVVRDDVTVGDARVEQLTCLFPDGSTGLQWAGPFESAAAFTCTAELSGVVGEHANVATVTAIGAGGLPVTDDDPFHAFTPERVSVGDYVWFDENRDGLQGTDEQGIEGVELTLTGPDGQQVTDVNGQPVLPTRTDANGAYSFDDLPTLPAGQSYTVTVTPPTGYEPTTPGAGSDRGLDSSTGSATSGDLVADGVRDATLDFGFVLPQETVTPTPTATATPTPTPTTTSPAPTTPATTPATTTPAATTPAATVPITTPSQTPTAVPVPPRTTPPSPEDSLATTGAGDLGPLLLIAGGVLVAGGVLALRRRTAR